MCSNPQNTDLSFTHSQAVSESAKAKNRAVLDKKHIQHWRMIRWECAARKYRYSGDQRMFTAGGGAYRVSAGSRATLAFRSCRHTSALQIQCGAKAYQKTLHRIKILTRMHACKDRGCRARISRAESAKRSAILKRRAEMARTACNRSKLCRARAKSARQARERAMHAKEGQG